MHRADPFMLDDEIADDTPAPQRPPLTPPSPPARAPEPVRTQQPAPEPVHARQPAPEPEPVRAPEVKSAPAPEPEPQRQAPKPAPAPASRKPGKRGRPKSANPKRQITLRLDAEVVDHFRAKGRGWQTRINSALREAAGIKGNNR